MIVKMKFLSITGPKKDLDRAIDTYLSKYEIQLENALTEFKTVRDLHPLNETNEYRDVYQKASELMKLLPADSKKQMESYKNTISLEEANSAIQDLDSQMNEILKEKNDLSAQLKENDRLTDGIDKFLELDYDIDVIFSLKFMKFRFGKMTPEYYEKYMTYFNDQLDAIFCKCHTDEQAVWGVYFVPASKADKVDAVFSSLHFERIHLNDEYDGTPAEAAKLLKDQRTEIMQKLAVIEEKEKAFLIAHANKLISSYLRINQSITNFEARKFAAYTKEDEHEFFLLCGWMAEADALQLQKEIEPDPDFFCVFEEDHENLCSEPPIKLKNPKLFRPFEMFTKMYGLPNYKEFDPTFLIAITYSFIFGIMFGDVGQGLVLLLGGALLYHKKKMSLAACVSCCGVFSTFFGFMFGSIFGFEDVIQPVWLRPMNAMTNLPFVGQLNTVFVLAIAFGMFLILLSMVLHIVSNIRMQDKGNTLFDANGVAGLVFYAAIVTDIVLFMTGHKGFGTAVAVIFFGLPLLCMALKEPLTKIVEKQAHGKPHGIGMFIVTTFFELFEVLLSYFSNTLSFVRIGAFAVSHAAMMEVVLMLAGAESGNVNWIVVICGNIFVCCLEGLIVGIQVLRLEYYEMFSRYYKGDGKEFKPFIPMKN